VAPIAVDEGGEREHEAARMELGLGLEAHGARDGIGKIGLLRVRRRQAEALGDLDLALDVAKLVARAGVRVVRLAPEIAVDPLRLDPLGDLLDPGLVGLAVCARAIVTEARRERPRARRRSSRPV
jgi:hypothetical protein